MTGRITLKEGDSIRLLVGTTNPTKKAYIREILSDLPIEAVGLDDLGIHSDIPENGKTPEENARKKAKAYCRISGMPTMSVDSGLYIDEFSPEKQPGQFVRRIYGSDCDVSDERLLQYYIDELDKVGGRSGATWVDATALALPSGEIHSTSIERRTIMISRPSQVILPRSPLTSLQITPEGRYHSEMTHRERKLLQRNLAVGINEFIGRHLALVDLTV